MLGRQNQENYVTMTSDHIIVDVFKTDLGLK